MSFNPSLIKGYAPTLEEILKDLKIDSPNDFPNTLMNKCRKLYGESKIKKFNDENFIICNSENFYKTLVNMGYGNCALAIMDDFGDEKYFLIFEDKVPKEFHEIVAMHELSEYKKVLGGIPQSKAHKEATNIEINVAKHLGKFEEYMKFLKENYPMKFDEIKNL